MNEKMDKILRENPKGTIESVIGKRKEVLEDNNRDNMVLLGIEVCLANAINYSEYKGYITPSEAEEYKRLSQ